MTAVTKFSFDTTFDMTDAPASHMPEQESAPPEPTFSAADLAAARAEGFDDGHRAGLAEGSAALEIAATDASNNIAAQLASLGPVCQTGLDRCRHDAIGIAKAVTRQTVELFAQDTALQVIEKVLADVLARVIDEPRVVIRVHNDILDSLQPRMSLVTAQCGFPGSVILLAEPGIQVPDCRIEWADGGAEYCHEEILTVIDDLIERYRAGIGADTPNSTDTQNDAATEPQRQTDAPPTEQIDIEEQPNG